MKRRSNYRPADPNAFIRLDMFDRAMAYLNWMEFVRSVREEKGTL